jgi:molecular chaperone GrpE
MADFDERDEMPEGFDPESVDPEALADFAGADAVNEDLVRERDEMRALAQRVQADFENYRKRMLREQTALSERASESLVEQLLPVLDNFELALLSLDDADEKVRKGVELVYADFLAVLERAGLQRIPTNGEPFDPEVHEAVAHEARRDEAGEPDHPTVVETMREGYRLKGRVLRPAMVKVAG